MTEEAEYMGDDADKLKLKLACEKRIVKKLEKQIDVLEREIYKEMKVSKDDIVDSIYSTIDGYSDYNRILRTTSNDLSQSRVELII